MSRRLGRAHDTISAAHGHDGLEVADSICLIADAASEA
jgi:hypothetical protein